MEIWYNYETAIKIRHCDKIWRSAVHIIAHNFFRQFLNVTFNEIFCLLALFLFYGTPSKSELFDQVGWKQNLTTDWGWDSVCWFNWFYASVGVEDKEMTRKSHMKDETRKKVPSIFIEKVVTEFSCQSKVWSIWKKSKNVSHI